MRFGALAGSLALVSILALSPGCKKADPLYCNNHLDCDNDVARPYCDLTGTLPGSDGLKHTCVPTPATDAGVVDAGMPDAASVHDAGLSLDSSIDAFDAAMCGVCGGTTPVCDTSAGACRGCRADTVAECASGACNLSTGACYPGVEVIHTATTGTDSGTCGDENSPCQTIAGAQMRIAGARNIIRLRPGIYREHVIVAPGGDIVLVGDGATIQGVDLGREVLTIGSQSTSQATSARVRGVTVRPPASSTATSVVGCRSMTTTSQLELTSVIVENSPRDGVLATGCALTLNKTTVRDSANSAVVADLPSAVIRSSSIENASFFCLDLRGAATIEATRVTGCAGGAVLLGNGTGFRITNNIFDNNNVGVGFGRRLLEPVAAPTSGGVLAFNTLVANAASAIDCGEVVATIVFRNNIVQGNGSALSSNTSGNCRFEFSDVQGNPTGMGNFDLVPMFIAPPSNYHLQQTSPVRNRGSFDSSVTVDIDGDVRSAGTVEPGADEI